MTHNQQGEFGDKQGVLHDTACDFLDMLSKIGQWARHNIIKILVGLFIVPGALLFAISVCVVWRYAINCIVSCYNNLWDSPIRAIFIFSLAILAIFWTAFMAIKRKDEYRKSDEGLREDIPQDQLYREAFVLTLTQRLCENGERCRYIGLYGKWGEGKTYVYRMMKAKTPEVANLEFVAFSPWDIPNGSITPTSLFTAIASRMAADVENDFRRFAARIDPSKSVSWIENIPWIGGALSWLYLVWRDPVRAKRKLSNVLKQRKKNVIVVIDDLDRLPPMEIYQTLRLIKANGDLPYVTYLILADKRYLASALDAALSLNSENNICNGMTYLEKIIPSECDLPPVSTDDLMDIALHRISQLSGKYPRVSFDWKNSDMSDIRPLIRSMRDVNRFVDAFAWSIAFHFSKARYKRKKQLEIWIPDLIALTALRVFAKEIYLSLFDYNDVLLNPERHAISHDWVVENLVHSKDHTLIDVAKRFLVARMGFSYEGSGSMVKNEPSKKNRRDYRINVLEYFKNYYCGFDSGLPGKDELASFLNELQDSDRAYRALQVFNRNNQLSRMFSLVAERPTPLNVAMSNNYLYALARMLDYEVLDKNIKNIDTRSYLSLGLPSHDAIEREILRVMRRRNYAEEDGIVTATLATIKESKGVNFAARFMILQRERVMDFAGIPSFIAMLTNGNVSKVLANCIMEAVGKDYDWDANVDKYNLHRAWFYCVKYYGNQEDREFYRNWATTRMRERHDYEFVVWPFVRLVQSKRGLVTINYGDLAEYLDLQNLKWGLKKYGEESLLYQMLSKLIVYCETESEANNTSAQGQIDYLSKDDEFSGENINDAIESEFYIA